MKNILIDTYKIRDLYSGLGQFSLNFANQLIIQQPADTEINFLVSKGSGFKQIMKNEKIRFVRTSLKHRYLPFLNPAYDIWHSLHQFPSHFPNPGSTWILTIHDLNFLHEKSPEKSARYQKRLQKNIDLADYITTISEYSKNQIETNLDLKGKNIRVIYNGIAPDGAVESQKPGFISHEKFFFSIGIFSRKKNFHTLLPVMQHFDDYKLILAGNADNAYGKEIQNEIKRLKLENKIIVPGKITEPEKYWLYHHCEAFLFPSLAEGFGMPVIEAMKAGKPVFLSKYTSLPEIGGDVAFYFDSFEPSDMSKLIKAKLNTFYQQRETNEKEVKQHAEKFTWEKCMLRYLELYKEIWDTVQ